MHGFIKGARALTEITAGMIPASIYFNQSDNNNRKAQARGDAGETLYGELALTMIQEGVYEAQFKPNALLDLIAFNTSGGAGLQSTKYFEGESRATFMRLGAKNPGFGTADAGTVPILQSVETYVSGWEMWLKDTEAAAAAGIDPMPRYARAVRAAYRQLMQDHCLYGDQESQIEGLLNSGRIKNRARLATALDENSTANDLYNALADIVKSIASTSEGLHDSPYALAVPGPLKRKCDTTFRGVDSTVSVTDWFQGSTGYQLIGIESLKEVDLALINEGQAGTTGAAVAGNFGSSMVLEKMVPRPFQQLAPHVDSAGLRTITPVVCDIGGWHIYDPTALAVRSNIWSES